MYVTGRQLNLLALACYDQQRADAESLLAEAEVNAVDVQIICQWIAEIDDARASIERRLALMQTHCDGLDASSLVR